MTGDREDQTLPVIDSRTTLRQDASDRRRALDRAVVARDLLPSPSGLASSLPAQGGQHQRHQQRATGPTAAGRLAGRWGLAGVADTVAVRVSLIRV